MKKIVTAILRNFGRLLGVLALCSFAAAGTAFAGTITKTFEFGPGTPYTRSNVRTFPVLCRKAVAVTVKVQTLGAAPGLVPITIELREPDTAPGQEGPLVEAKNITARTLEQTVTLSGPFKNRGCSLPWRVRVSHANEGTAPFLTTGTIKVDFDSAGRNINPEMTSLYSGNSTTKNLGSTGGLEEGGIVITGKWQHWIGLGGIGGQGPLAVRLRFELIDPSGTVVKTADGFSSDEARSESTHPKLKLIYQVTNCTPGQWKLKITNLSGLNDVNYVQSKATFTPDCP